MVEDKIIKKLNSLKVNISEEVILERFLDRYRWPKQYSWGQPSIEAINPNGSKDQDFFHEDGYVDSERCIKRYEDGYSLIISNIGGFCKDTWIIQQILNQHYMRHINCNFYFGNGKKSISFDKHDHDYPVIVKNIYGESKWVIDEKEVILKNQECIWFDKFTKHQVIEISDAKLSMTCNIE